MARPRAALSTGTGRSHYLKEGGREEVWKAPPPFLRYTCPAVTAQSGNSGARSPRTRERASGSQRPAGAIPGAGRAPPAGWYGPRGGSRVSRALGGDPVRPRAEPPNEAGPGPRSGPGRGWSLRRYRVSPSAAAEPLPGASPRLRAVPCSPQARRDFSIGGSAPTVCLNSLKCLECKIMADEGFEVLSFSDL